MDKLRAEITPKRTGGKRTVADTVFEIWHIGILLYEWRSADGRIHIGSNGSHHSTYWASVDSVGLGIRFRSRLTAARAAVKTARKGDVP